MQRGRWIAHAAGWTVLAATLVLSVAAAWAERPARLDPSLALWLDAVGTARAGAPDGLQIVPSLTGEARLRVLVTADGAADGSLGGVPVECSTGSVGTMSVTREELRRVLADDRVVYAEPSRATRAALDVSVPEIGASTAHRATPPMLGQGVVVGLVDTGIDIQHLDFRYDADHDGFEESSRVLALWDQTWGLFGAVYDRDDIDADLATGAAPGTGVVKLLDRDGHGTHVASIAAGDGSSSPAGFVGVAPGAWIVAVKTTFFTADILEAVAFIFEESERRGMPAVANLSLGGQAGPHDGTSAFERGLDELGSGPGRAVVVSAGNEGSLELHLSGTLQGGSKSFEIEAGAREVTMELWYPGGSRFAVSLASPSGASLTAPAGAGSGFVPTADGVAYIDNASGGVNPNNGDREAFVRITNTSAGATWRVTVRDDGGGGRFDAWVTSSTGRFVDGDSAMTIDEPGNARGAITVGAYNSKAVWPSEIGMQDDLDEVEVGHLSDFSSRGPTRDGRIKPDLTGPGTWVCAALSATAVAYADLTHPDGVHAMHRGTSMSAPHVAGTIALMFEIRASMTGSEAKDLLTSTAVRDELTGATPNARWGYGKLDAWAALREVGPGEPPPPQGDRPTARLRENPAVDQASFVYSLPDGTAAAWLRVYDAAGRRVFEVPLSVDASDYIWDLTSQGGGRVSAGLYLYLVTSDRGTSAVERLVVGP